MTQIDGNAWLHKRYLIVRVWFQSECQYSIFRPGEDGMFRTIAAAVYDDREVQRLADREVQRS
jgi:hypothetical protein